MPEYIFKMEKRNGESLGSVRCMDGLQVAEEDDHIWLKAQGLSELSVELMQLPVKSTYIKDEYDNLFIPGKLTPEEVLREMSWQPLTGYIKVESPVAALPGIINQKIEIRLVSSIKERKGKALLTSLSLWKHYAETAPGTRLSALKFAVSENNEVLIIGTPLPPLPGTEFWDAGNILIPSGYDLEVDLMKDFIQRKLNEHNSSFVVFDSESRYQLIDKNFFVAAKRSAVRSTMTE